MIRSRLYKNSGKDNDELRRRRIDQSVELRKAKKEQQLQKRRNVLRDVQETSQVECTDLKASSPASYDKIISDMESPNNLVRLNATRMCRKMLSRAKNPPIDEFFERGAVKVLVRALDSDPSNNDLVFEAAWALTNIASGESHHTQGVVEGGAAPKLIRLLSHEDVRVAEQCIWALGNIAGDGCSYRDMLISLGAVTPSLQLLERAWESASVVSNIAWMLSNLCRNKNPNPPRQTVLSLLPVFKRLLEYPLSQEVVIDTAWALSYASDCAGEFIDDILQSGCIPILVRLLGSNSPNLVSPALRAVGNLILGDDEQTQVVVDSGVLQYAQGLLNSDRPSIVKEACWMLSNITAGNLKQIQAVIEANLVPRIVKLVEEAEFKIQKEACWVISNIVNGGSPEQRAYLLNNGALEALSKLLNVSDARVLKLVLETIKKMFETADQYGQLEPCCVALELCGGLNSIEQLQDHTNDEVYRIAYDFIAQFFSDTDEAAGTEATTGEPDQTVTAVAPTRDSNEFHFRPQQNDPRGANFEF